MTHFNKESFDKALDQGKLMMVDFWAELVRALPYAGSCHRGPG